MRNSNSERRRSMAVAAFGTVVEWYDFSIFFYTSMYLAHTFYAPFEGSVLLALATGAVGFLFRPLGAMVFGHFGDKIGRRAALVISAGLMAVAMFGIAVMPGHETLGVWAAVLVVVLRSLAGFSVGAEYTGITVFLMESARDGRRGFVASWAAANSEVGALLAVGLTTWLAFALPPEQMQEWGWRALFVFGGLLAALMIPLRKLMIETESFTRAAATRQTGERQVSPLWLALRRQPRAILVAFLISTVGSATYFLNITYVPTYLEATTEIAVSKTLLYGTVAAVIAIAVTPLLGWLSDVYGRRIVFAALLLTVAGGSLPAYLLLHGAGQEAVLHGAGQEAVLLGVALLAVPAAGWSAVAAAAVPEQFTAGSRFSGMAIGYNLAVAVFGGFSPLIVTWLMQVTGNVLAPAYYAALLCTAAGVPALLLLRNMARQPLRVIDGTAAEPATAVTAAS